MLPSGPHDSITDIPGIKVGHWTDLEAATGCSVVLCERGAVGGVDVRGGAPGTRETDLLRPGNSVQEVHAVLLSGGSAFGLEAAGGVMRWCEEHGIGLFFGGRRIPIVPAAILFDLGLGSGEARPDAAAGYAATAAASSAPPAQGSVGAGTGATGGKARGRDHSVKGGIGTASVALAGGMLVAAIVAVNAFGEVFDGRSGRVVAGPRADGNGFADSLSLLLSATAEPAEGNTTIGVVATNAALTKEQANRLAGAAHDGLARSIRPLHTSVDGDTIFALATGEVPLQGRRALLALESLASVAVERAVLKAVEAATSLAGVPAAAEWLALNARRG
jgi:L-aminopeptidase/D-esterase-like protein